MPDSIASVAAKGLDFGPVAPQVRTEARQGLRRSNLCKLACAEACFKSSFMGGACSSRLPGGGLRGQVHSVSLLAVEPDPGPGAAAAAAAPVAVRVRGAYVADDFSFALVLRMSSLQHAYL